MRQASLSVLIITALSTGAASAAPVLSYEGQAPAYSFPVIPGVPRPSLGPASEGNPGVTAPLIPAPKTTPPAKTEQTTAERLDDLFQRLAHAEDADEANGLAEAIQRLWLHSGSDTADLLMVRAVTALTKGESKVATDLLDRIVALDPGWAEAWNKRATLRFLKGDDAGAMQDIAQVLALEPRHFGALSGMAAILQRAGMDKQALALIRRVETIYPHNADLEKLEGQLSLKVEGREI